MTLDTLVCLYRCYGGVQEVVRQSRDLGAKAPSPSRVAKISSEIIWYNGSRHLLRSSHHSRDYRCLPGSRTLTSLETGQLFFCFPFNGSSALINKYRGYRYILCKSSRHLPFYIFTLDVVLLTNKLSSRGILYHHAPFSCGGKCREITVERLWGKVGAIRPCRLSCEVKWRFSEVFAPAGTHICFSPRNRPDKDHLCFRLLYFSRSESTAQVAAS